MAADRVNPDLGVSVSYFYGGRVARRVGPRASTALGADRPAFVTLYRRNIRNIRSVSPRRSCYACYASYAFVRWQERREIPFPSIAEILASVSSMRPATKDNGFNFVLAEMHGQIPGIQRLSLKITPGRLFERVKLT